MTLLHMLSYVGAVAAFIFITLSLASGLLWLSELIEEHSRLAKIIGQRSIYVIIVLHVLLYLLDSLPLWHISFSIFCHIIYLQNFTSSWPFISLTSLNFIASCVLVVADHFMWFFYFSRVTQDARHRIRRPYRNSSPVQNVSGFADIATFFGICVWLVPLFLFLSLSANDNALPMNAGQSSVPPTPTAPARPLAPRARTSLFKSIYDSLPRIRRTRRHDTYEGIIAPPSPNIPHRSPSPIRPTASLQRVPSMSDLPPLSSPGRRASNDGYTSEGATSVMVADSSAHDSSNMLSPFTLKPPPRRMSGAETSLRRLPTEGQRVKMRRGTYTSSERSGTL